MRRRDTSVYEREWADARTVADLQSLTTRWLLRELPWHPIHESEPHRALGMRARRKLASAAPGLITTGVKVCPWRVEEAGIHSRPAWFGYMSPMAAERMAGRLATRRVPNFGWDLAIEPDTGEADIIRTYGEENYRLDRYLHPDAVAALSGLRYVAIAGPMYADQVLWQTVVTLADIIHNWEREPVPA